MGLFSGQRTRGFCFSRQVAWFVSRTNIFVFPHQVVPLPDGLSEGDAEGAAGDGREAPRRGDHVVQVHLPANTALRLAREVETGESDGGATTRGRPRQGLS